MNEKDQILSYAFLRYQDVTDIIYDFIFDMEETLRTLATFRIANDVTELQKKLDPTSRLIVDYFLKNKSASIRELSELVSTKSDYEVISVIREIINTQAQDILGYPLLQFKRSYIDPVTGMKLLFRWWISDEIMELLEENDFDCVVSDYNMLQLNGIELAKTVRETSGYRKMSM